MTDDEKLLKRGETVFAKMDNDDKRALKRFLTGQIQNILANEHGIGGKKDIANAVDSRVEGRIQSFAKDERLMQRLAEILAKDRKIDFPKLILDAAKSETKDQITKAAGQAARRVKIDVYIEPATDEPETETRLF